MLDKNYLDKIIVVPMTIDNLIICMSALMFLMAQDNISYIDKLMYILNADTLKVLQEVYNHLNES